MKKFAIVLLIITLGLTASAQLSYSVNYSDSLRSRIKVSIHFASERKGAIDFIMPRSVPGAYSVIKYDRYIEDLLAFSKDKEKISLLKDINDAPRWRTVDTGKSIISIEYEVDLKKMERGLSPSDASITRSNFVGLLNYSIFGWVEGTELEPVQCIVKTFEQWPIFTTIKPTERLSKGTMTFKADSYYELADAQIFIGPKLRVKEFKGIVPLFIASYCETKDEFLDDYGKQGVLSLEILNNYFGELPFKEYSILLRKALPLEPGAVPAFGMEHLQSSTFFGDTSGFRANAMNHDDVIKTMPTYLHHMGHAILPLRCYGDSYLPHVKEIPPIINNIWFNEGFMWFLPYEELKSEYLFKRFQANSYGADPQIKKMSLEKLSQESSVMYSVDFRLGKAVFSRGAMMAIEMNKYLMEKTSGKKSLKDVLRYLYNWSKEKKRAFTMEEFPILITEATGIDLGAIYNKWQLPIEL